MLSCVTRFYSSIKQRGGIWYSFGQNVPLPNKKLVVILFFCIRMKVNVTRLMLPKGFIFKRKPIFQEFFERTRNLIFNLTSSLLLQLSLNI